MAWFGRHPWGMPGRGGGPGRTHAVAFGMVVLLCGLLPGLTPAPAAAERIFHERHHTDQHIIHNVRLVKTETIDEKSALEYLKRYGYLECSPGPSKPSQRSRSTFPIFPNFSPREDVAPAKQNCPSEAIDIAVRKYQKNFGLKQTGNIDMDTINTMNKRRCGNSDDTTDENPTPKPETHSEKSSTEKKTRKRRNALNIIEENHRHLPIKPTENTEPTLSEKSPILNALSQHINLEASNSYVRRMEMLKEYRERIRREAPFKRDNTPIPEERVRVRRATDDINITSTAFNLDGGCIKWRLLDAGYSNQITPEEQRAVLRLAFRVWSEVIPICFDEDYTSRIQDIHIQIGFGRDQHLDCDRDFDGKGGELGHSIRSKEKNVIHFDDDEEYSASVVDNGVSTTSVNLLVVSMHEIGHTLGLVHTSKYYSIMYAMYVVQPDSSTGFELCWEDRKLIQNIYGKCKGNFNVVFDWIRKTVDKQGFMYNTYFFRNQKYWMYENRRNRTRYGDPLIITYEWLGVPGNVDGYAQPFIYHDNKIWLETYFFKGEDYFYYDNDLDRVWPERPRKIRDEFITKPGLNTSDEDNVVPVNMDAAFFNPMEMKIFFFKGSKVWLYNYKNHIVARSTNTSDSLANYGCCDATVEFSTLFPSDDPDNHPINGYVSAVYYSASKNKVYIIKDEDVWETDTLTKITLPYTLTYIGKWFDLWFDICDPSI